MRRTKEASDPRLQGSRRLDRLAPEGTLRRRVLRFGRRARMGWGLLFAGRQDEVQARDVAAEPLDVYDDAAVLRMLADHFLPRGSPGEADSDVRGAARWVLALLRRRADLRRRFPHALGAGVEGPFCRWLCLEGAKEFTLSPAAVEHVRQAFRERPGDRVRQLFAFRRDLREAFPLAMTPAGRSAFFLWLLFHGRSERRIQSEEIWWFLLECTEDPVRELARCYAINPAWQRAFPDALTAFGLGEFLTWLNETYGTGEIAAQPSDLVSVLRPADQLRLAHAHRDALRALAPRAFVDAGQTTRLIHALRPEDQVGSALDDDWWRAFAADDAAGLLERSGVNVLGHFCCPIGLRTTAVTNVRALERAGLRTSCRDVPADPAIDFPTRDDYLGHELFDVTLIHVQPEPFFRECYARAALAPREGVYRVAVWYWELQRAPAHWGDCCDALDEVWAPTEFVARALRGVVPVPVVRMLPGLDLGEVAKVPRSRWGLDPSKFTFLFVFDAGSVIQRKNPLGLVQAFRRAFRSDDGVDLVIKVSRGKTNPEEFARLKEAAREAGVTLIDRVMSHEETCEMIGACDAYVSLHRSEGLGLTLAEAMLLGKPVIATGYSGNLDFMTSENSLLVDYELVPLEEDYPPYSAGACWAEPSIEHAEQQLRWVHEHRDAARALGVRAQSEVRHTLSLESAGRRMADRLAEIRAGRLRRAAGIHGGRAADTDGYRARIARESP